MIAKHRKAFERGVGFHEPASTWNDFPLAPRVWCRNRSSATMALNPICEVHA